MAGNWLDLILNFKMLIGRRMGTYYIGSEAVAKQVASLAIVMMALLPTRLHLPKSDRRMQRRKLSKELAEHSES